MQTKPFEGRSSEMRKTPWLASEDILGLGDVKVKVSGCFLHRGAEFDDGRKEDVFALSFEGKEKQLVLNATNRKTLVGLFGPNVKDWTGKEISLYVTKVKAFGEMVNGIRIRAK